MAKILVVEDNEQNRILIRQLLTFHGHDLLEACDGAEGIRLIADQHPDLVLMDLQMPVVDGFSVLRQIRAMPGLSKTKVVAVTSLAMKGDREKALEAGFDEYITKPIDTRNFPRIISKVLGRVCHEPA